MSEWISIADRAPEPGARVLCYCNDGIQRIGIAGKYSFIFGAWDFVANYWMPLPEPPKE